MKRQSSNPAEPPADPPESTKDVNLVTKQVSPTNGPASSATHYIGLTAEQPLPDTQRPDALAPSRDSVLQGNAAEISDLGPPPSKRHRSAEFVTGLLATVIVKTEPADTNSVPEQAEGAQPLGSEEHVPTPEELPSAQRSSNSKLLLTAQSWDGWKASCLKRAQIHNATASKQTNPQHTQSGDAEQPLAVPPETEATAVEKSLTPQSWDSWKAGCIKRALEPQPTSGDAGGR